MVYSRPLLRSRKVSGDAVGILLMSQDIQWLNAKVVPRFGRPW